MTIKFLYQTSKERYEKVCRREEALLKELETLKIEKEHHGKLVELYSNMEYDSIEEERQVTDSIIKKTAVVKVTAPQTQTKKARGPYKNAKTGIREIVYNTIKDLGQATMEDLKILHKDNGRALVDAIYVLKKKGRITKEKGIYRVIS